jgi:hypothetical protein
MTQENWEELLRLLQSEPPRTADEGLAIDRMFRPQRFSWGRGCCQQCRRLFDRKERGRPRKFCTNACRDKYRDAHGRGGKCGVWRTTQRRKRYWHEAGCPPIAWSWFNAPDQMSLPLGTWPKRWGQYGTDTARHGNPRADRGLTA